jgi:circadian clock protein KaiB
VTLREESEASSADARTVTWRLRLYVAGQSPKSLVALMNLRRLCATLLIEHYHIEVIDLLEHPHLASQDQILAIPTLVRIEPAPLRKVIGDLSATERVVAGLELPRP